jgi:glyoxylase I family protein
MTVLSHIGICVSDMDASMRFYCGVFGFEKGRLYTTGNELSSLLGIDGNLEFQSLFLSKDNLLLELLQFTTPGHVGAATARPMNKLGFTHFSFRVDQIDLVAAKVAEYGGALLEATRTKRLMPGGYVEEIMFCTDPDGTRIELLKVPENVQFS